MGGFALERALQRRAQLGMLLGREPLLVVERPDHALVGGELGDRLRLDRAGHRSNQDAVGVGDGGDDPIGQLVLQLEEAAGAQVAVEGLGP